MREIRVREDYSNLSELLRTAPSGTDPWELWDGATSIARGRGSVVSGIEGKLLPLKTGAVSEDSSYGYNVEAGAGGVSQTSSGLVLTASDSAAEVRVRFPAFGTGIWGGVLFVVDLSSSAQVNGGALDTSTRIEVRWVETGGNTGGLIYAWNGSAFEGKAFVEIGGTYTYASVGTGAVAIGSSMGVGVISYVDTTVAAVGDAQHHGTIATDYTDVTTYRSTYGRKHTGAALQSGDDLEIEVKVHQGGAGGQIAAVLRSVRLQPPAGVHPT